MHVEVKIDDPHLDKTFDTAAALREQEPTAEFRDYILIKKGAKPAIE